MTTDLRTSPRHCACSSTAWCESGRSQPIITRSARSRWPSQPPVISRGSSPSFIQARRRRAQMSVLDHNLSVASETSGSAGNRPRWEKRRMHHVFAADGRTVVVAMDHCITWGAVAGLIDAKDAVRKVIAGGADAVMTTIGMGRTVRDEIGGAGSIVVLDSERSVVSYGIDA